MRSQPLRAELDGKPVGKGSFSRRRRSGNHHKFHIASCHNLLGNFSYPPLLLCLLYQNHIADVSGADRIVQITHGCNIYLFIPLFRFGKSFKKHIPVGSSRHNGRLLRIRQNKKHSFLIRNQIKILHISRIGKHKTVIIVVKAFHFVDIHKRGTAVTEQFFLVLHAALAEQLHSLFQIVGLFNHGHFQFHKLMHSNFHFFHKFRCNGKIPRSYIIAGAYGKFHAALLRQNTSFRIKNSF